MDKDKLSETLRKHKQWLDDMPGGERANLRRANLRRANLQDADLWYAELLCAYLWEADLRDADLQHANLQHADLQGADLRGANLQHANLQHADLRRADLRDANLWETDLRGADLDFSCWPLWCGSLGVKVDARIARQLAYHFCRLDCDDPEYQAAREAIKDFANEFHRAKECGKIKTHDQAQDFMGELPKGEDNE